MRVAPCHRGVTAAAARRGCHGRADVGAERVLTVAAARARWRRGARPRGRAQAARLTRRARRTACRAPSGRGRARPGLRPAGRRRQRLRRLALPLLLLRGLKLAPLDVLLRVQHGLQARQLRPERRELGVRLPLLRPPREAEGEEAAGGCSSAIARSVTPCCVAAAPLRAPQPPRVGLEAAKRVPDRHGRGARGRGRRRRDRPGDARGARVARSAARPRSRAARRPVRIPAPAVAAKARDATRWARHALRGAAAAAGGAAAACAKEAAEAWM